MDQNYQEVEESLDIKKWIGKILGNWYWFAICGFIGLVFGYGYNKIAQPEYELKSLLLSETDSKSTGMEELFSAQVFGKKSHVINHIGILKSHSIISTTLKKLDWRTFWFKERFTRRIDLYNDGPFVVSNISDYLNLRNVPLYVTTLSDSTYRINVDIKMSLEDEGVKKRIKFDQKGKFGEEFSNNYFKFILNKSKFQIIEPDIKYFFVFNDPNRLTLSYQERVEVSAFDAESDLIQLKLRGEHPQRESDFLNQLAEIYIDFGMKKKNKISENTIKFIDTQLGGIVDSLQTAGDDFTDFRSKNRIVDLSQEAVLLVEQIKKLEYTESMAKMKVDYYKNLQKYLGDATQMEHMVAPSVVGIEDPSLNALVVKMSELYAKRNAIASSLTKINPARIAMEKEIEYTKKILDENLKNLISNVNTELQSFDQRKNALNYKLTVMPKTEQNLINYKRKFDVNNELYTFLMQKSAEAAITKASNQPDIQILDYASVETATSLGPDKKIFYIVGIILGSLIPLFIIILKDFLTTTINSKEEVEKKTDISIVGEIIKNSQKNELPILSVPHSGISESIRALRTNLHFLLAQDSSNVISIHSSIPGEGKTFVSANLATSIALNNKKVLVICSDLRKPRIHKIFETENNVGLSTYLIRKNTFEEVISETSIKNLFFVPSGPIPPNPSELLCTEKFKAFIKLARERFDYIIFDNAPAFIVTDSIIVGNQSDINLFVMRQGVTYKENLKMINQLKNQNKLQNMYLIFNGINSDKSGYYKIYGQGYGNFNKSKNTLTNTNKMKRSTVEIES